MKFHWTAYVTALTVPVLAFVGETIAYRQWRTAQNKLKLDLFDKRMRVYQAVRDALGHIASHGKLGNEQQIAYLSGIQEAKWLFGPEVHTYLSETLWHKIVELELHQTMVYDAPTDHPDRSKHIQLKADTLKWLIAQYSVLDEKCANYMVLVIDLTINSNRTRFAGRLNSGVSMQSAVTPHSGRLYRIMRFERVVQMFERNELTFSKPLLWEDPYETHFKHTDLDSVFAQCWCARGVSDAMWRIYSPDRTGIRISTSTKLLRNAVAAEAALAGFDYIERGVEYLPPVRLRNRISALRKNLGNRSSGALASDCLFLKREAFDHEHEYRVVLSPKGESSHGSEIIAMPCNPHKFVDSILIDPRAPKELADAFIYYFKNKIGFKRRVQSSALYRVPTPVSSL